MKVAALPLIRKEVGHFVEFLRSIISFKRYILLLGIISFVYVFILLFYTHGALLFNGDNVGFYHLSLGLFDTPTGALSGLSLLLSFGDVYVAFYLYLYLSFFIGMLASFYLSFQILNIFLPKEKVVISSIISASLYVITPYVLVDYYSSFIGNLVLSSSFFTLFLAFLFRSYSSRVNQSRFLNSILLSGAFLGLSVTPFPNDVRVMILGYLFFASIIIFFLISSFFSSRKMAVIRVSLSTIIFAFASVFFSLFQSYKIFYDIPAFLHLASVASANYTYLGFYTGSFNTIPQVIRLLGIWVFPTGFDIYHNVYYGMNFINISSYFWPILALFFPLVVVYRLKNNKGFLLFIMILILVSIFWEKGANPPFGTLWYSINRVLPFGYQLIPTGELQSDFLAKVYPILATLSIVTIYQFLKGRKGIISKKKLKRLVVLVPVALIVILVVAEMPVFNGQLEANFFNEKTSGFYIPDEYNYARDYLLGSHGNVLLLPGVQTYIITTWNFQGSSAIYNAFFQPVNVIDIQTFGGGYSSPSQVKTYDALASPILTENNYSSISTSWLQTIVNYNISYLLLDFSISNGIINNYTYYSRAISLLIQDHIVTQTLSFEDIKIYKINRSQVSKTLERQFYPQFDQSSHMLFPDVAAVGQNSTDGVPISPCMGTAVSQRYMYERTNF
ncbi:MAG: hypothetical protein QXQ46_03640 [Thermoplasmatales archaeon]